MVTKSKTRTYEAQKRGEGDAYLLNMHEAPATRQALGKREHERRWG